MMSPRRIRSPRARVVLVAAVAGMLVAGLAIQAALLAAQAGPPPAGGQAGAPAQGERGRRGGGGGGRGGPIAFDDNAGFTQIFDGTTTKGWDGDPGFWRVEAGALVGETTAANPLKVNTFMVWRGGEPANFDLKLEFRINATNSGVQYRSTELTDVGKWVLKGYQADIDFANQYTGMLYEERGRMFLAPRGTVGYVTEGQPSRTVGTVEDGEALKAHIKVNDWNQFRVIARGNVLMHVLNGHVMAAVVDDDTKGRAMKGLIGLQLHVGPPMKVEFRNIWLKNLP